MNFKTTLLLFVLVVVVVGAIFVFESKSPPARPTLPPESTTPQQTAEKPLIDSFGDAVTIKVQSGDNDPWHFERDVQAGTGPSAGWNMLEPMACGVSDWQVAQIANRIKGLKYTVKYDTPADGITPEQAGLDVPRATVAIVDEQDEKVEIEIGRNEGDQESYVRLAGADTIYRVRPSLKDLLKERAAEYREQQLFVIRPNSIVQIAVTERAEDGTTKEYELIKSGADWRFTKPAPAKAVAEKIRSVASGFRSLRALAWVDGNAEDLAVYGLDPAPLTVTVTTEEVLESPTDSSSNGEVATPPEPVTKAYTASFSSVGPLGEDNKAYLRAGDQRAVATIMKTTADTFKPDLKAWRDNRLIERDPAQAQRLSITTDGAATTFQRAGLDWAFAETNAAADRTEIRKVLDALKDTQALNFEAGIAGDPERFGFEAPRGVVELEFADGGQTRLVFGAYADPKTERLVYLRVDDGDAAIKLHKRDVARMLRQPGAFRDRTVAAVAENKLRGVTLTSPVEGQPLTVKLEKQDRTWGMSEPVISAVDDAAMRRLVALLGNFQATRLIDRGKTPLADYGLADPPVRLVYTYQPDKIVQMSSSGVKTVDAEPQALELHAAQKDNKIYLLRVEDDSTVYEAPNSVWPTLTAEYRKTDLFNFDAEQVSKVTWRDGDDTQGFQKDAGKWTYLPEADIPLNEAAVTTYVLRVRELKVTRVVEYDAADLAQYGLDAPAYELAVEIEGQALPALEISSRMNEQGAYYAKSVDAPHVFLLPIDLRDRVQIELSEFEQGR